MCVHSVATTEGIETLSLSEIMSLSCCCWDMVVGWCGLVVMGSDGALACEDEGKGRKLPKREWEGPPPEIIIFEPQVRPTQLFCAGRIGAR